MNFNVMSKYFNVIDNILSYFFFKIADKKLSFKLSIN